MIALEGRYSIKRDRYKLQVSTDSRLENSPVHFTTLARMSQLELMQFHGFGNSTPGLDSAYFDVHQRQWLFHPAIALALAKTSDLTFGPVVQYFATDTARGHFISDSQPYGFGRTGTFGEAGLRVSLHQDNRVPPRHPNQGTVLDLGASYFPGVWDVKTAFGEIDAAAGCT